MDIETVLFLCEICGDPVRQNLVSIAVSKTHLIFILVYILLRSSNGSKKNG